MIPLPTGRTIARALRQLFTRQQAKVLADLRFGRRSFDLSGWTKPAIEAFTPLITPIYADGATQAMRRIERQAARLGVQPHPFTVRTLFSYRGGACVEIQAKREPAVSFDVTNPRVQEFIRQQVFHFIDSANQTTAELLRAAMSEALEEGEPLQQIARRVMAIFGDPYRSTMIAATEASRAVHAGQLLAAKDSGVVRAKVWQASTDACDRCLAMMALGEIPLDQPFAVTGGGYYGVVMHPPLHPHDMCAMLEVVGR